MNENNWIYQDAGHSTDTQRSTVSLFLIFLFSLTWRCRVFVASGEIFSCGLPALSCSTWRRVPWPGIGPRPPAWAAWSLSHWTTREVPTVFLHSINKGFPGGSVVKNLPANAGDTSWIPKGGRSLEEGNGNPLQCSSPWDPMDRAWVDSSPWGRRTIRHDLGTKQHNRNKQMEN